MLPTYPQEAGMGPRRGSLSWAQGLTFRAHTSGQRTCFPVLPPPHREVTCWEAGLARSAGQSPELA